MYAFNSRVRYSEVDSGGKLALESVLDYFQDCSTFHSEDIGLGIDFLSKRELAWVLSSWQIEIKRYPELGELIKIVTIPYEFKGFMGMRNFYLEDENGEKIALANSVWTLLNTTTGRPNRLLPGMVEKYEFSEKLQMAYLPRKINVPVEYEECEPVEIKKHHLDTNHHVNNGQYLRIAMEYANLKGPITLMRAEYKKSALLGDIMIPRINREYKKCTISLCNEKREIYAVIQLGDFTL